MRTGEPAGELCLPSTLSCAGVYRCPPAGSRTISIWRQDMGIPIRRGVSGGCHLTPVVSGSVQRSRGGLTLRKAEHSQSVRSEEFRPYLVLESDVGHLGHDPFQGKTHREIPGIDDLVGTTTVCVVDDVFRVVLGSEGAG